MVTWRPNNSKSILRTKIRKWRSETERKVYCTKMDAGVAARSVNSALELCSCSQWFSHKTIAVDDAFPRFGGGGGRKSTLILWKLLGTAFPPIQGKKKSEWGHWNSKQAGPAEGNSKTLRQHCNSDFICCSGFFLPFNQCVRTFTRSLLFTCWYLQRFLWLKPDGGIKMKLTGPPE